MHRHRDRRVRVPAQDRDQVRPGDRDGRGRLDRLHRRRTVVAGEQRELADDAAGADLGERDRLPVGEAAHHLHAAPLDHVAAVAAVALLEDGRPGLPANDLRLAGERVEFVTGKRRQELHSVEQGAGRLVRQAHVHKAPISGAADPTPVAGRRGAGYARAHRPLERHQRHGWGGFGPGTDRDPAGASHLITPIARFAVRYAVPVLVGWAIVVVVFGLIGRNAEHKVQPSLLFIPGHRVPALARRALGELQRVAHRPARRAAAGARPAGAGARGGAPAPPAHPRDLALEREREAAAGAAPEPAPGRRRRRPADPARRQHQHRPGPDEGLRVGAHPPAGPRTPRGHPLTRQRGQHRLDRRPAQGRADRGADADPRPAARVPKSGRGGRPAADRARHRRHGVRGDLADPQVRHARRRDAERRLDDRARAGGGLLAADRDPLPRRARGGASAEAGRLGRGEHRGPHRELRRARPTGDHSGRVLPLPRHDPALDGRRDERRDDPRHDRRDRRDACRREPARAPRERVADRRRALRGAGVDRADRPPREPAAGARGRPARGAARAGGRAGAGDRDDTGRPARPAQAQRRTGRVLRAAQRGLRARDRRGARRPEGHAARSRSAGGDQDPRAPDRAPPARPCRDRSRPDRRSDDGPAPGAEADPQVQAPAAVGGGRARPALARADQRAAHDARAERRGEPRPRARPAPARFRAHPARAAPAAASATCSASSSG